MNNREISASFGDCNTYDYDVSKPKGFIPEFNRSQCSLCEHFATLVGGGSAIAYVCTLGDKKPYPVVDEMSICDMFEEVK
jgi:hypothetical protein